MYIEVRVQYQFNSSRIRVCIVWCIVLYAITNTLKKHLLEIGNQCSCMKMEVMFLWHGVRDISRTAELCVRCFNGRFRYTPLQYPADLH